MVLFAIVAALSGLAGWAFRDAKARAELKVLSTRVEDIYRESRDRDGKVAVLELVKERREDEWDEWRAKEPAPAPECLVTAPVWDPRWLARHRPRSEEGKGGK